MATLNQAKSSGFVRITLLHEGFQDQGLLLLVDFKVQQDPLHQPDV